MQGIEIFIRIFMHFDVGIHEKSIQRVNISGSKLKKCLFPNQFYSPETSFAGSATDLILSLLLHDFCWYERIFPNNFSVKKLFLCKKQSILTVLYRTG